MSSLSEEKKTKLRIINRRIKDGFYFTKGVKLIIINKLLKELFRTKVNS